jgi:hypothetical protein
LHSHDPLNKLSKRCVSGLGLAWRNWHNTLDKACIAFFFFFFSFLLALSCILAGRIMQVDE